LRVRTGERRERQFDLKVRRDGPADALGVGLGRHLVQRRLDGFPKPALTGDHDLGDQGVTGLEVVIHSRRTQLGQFGDFGQAHARIALARQHAGRGG
jgi:hypothetical protein